MKNKPWMSLDISNWDSYKIATFFFFRIYYSPYFLFWILQMLGSMVIYLHFNNHRITDMSYFTYCAKCSEDHSPVPASNEFVIYLVRQCTYKQK